MYEEKLLLNPGPVPVQQDVLESMTEPMISHRSDEFEDIYSGAQSNLQRIFEHSTLSGRKTSSGGTCLILNGSATMSMESIVANTVSERDEVVSIVNGKFGRRFAKIAERYTENVRRVECEWGGSISIEDVSEAISDSTNLVTAVHNETSTGILNPVWAFGEVADRHDALFAVDSVTSLGGDVFCINDWNIDVAVTGSQKALESPPGISAVYLTEDMREHLSGDSAPFYQDLEWHLRKEETNQTPFTSAVPIFRALEVATNNILEEGLSDRIQRHHRQALAFRTGFQKMGLDIFPETRGQTVTSNTVTAVELPETIRGEKSEMFFRTMNEYGVSVSGGQAHLDGDIFRVSNMGSLSVEQIIRGVKAVGQSLQDLSVDVDTKLAVSSARSILEETSG